MSNRLILVLPNFEERSESLYVEENNTIIITDDEGLSPVLAAVLSVKTHEYILDDLKCRHLSDTTDVTNVFTEYKLRDDLEDFDDYDLAELAFELSKSDTPTLRGNRTVLIDVGNNTIYVGTAVVYNPRRATVGVVDDSVAEFILNF